MGNFHVADLAIIGLYLVFAFSMGPIFLRFARRSTTDFFLSGRTLPWWVSGTSMVATTFGAGTPLLITGFIWGNGIFMNWWWWSFALSNVLTVVFFARLWRRAKVTTDVEFSELRYGGKPGAWLRGFRAVYFGGFVNTFIMAWLMFGAVSVVATLLGYDLTEEATKANPTIWAIILGLVALVATYSSMAGLWGVVTTDLVQFGIAMVSCTYLAVAVVNKVGGIASLKQQVISIHPLGEGALAFFPTPGLPDIPWIMLASFFLAQWWSSYYPGSEPGGGAYVAQRMLASKTEKHAQLATLWFTVAHYAVRPWPWILTAMATVVLYPELMDSTANNIGMVREATYVRAIVDFLPAGWMGAMVAFLCAAFMSTVDTHLNWGASYLIRDLYVRFIKPGKSETHYVVMSRVAMVVTAVIAAFVAMFLIKSIGDANRYLVGLMAGIGLVFVARFYWWRVNAWSEISAMLGAVVINGALQIWTVWGQWSLDMADKVVALGPKAATLAVDAPILVRLYDWFADLVPNSGDQGAVMLMVGTVVVNVLWILVTLCTEPEERAVLYRFYERVQPPGPGWRKISAELGIPYQGLDKRDLIAFFGCLALVWGGIYCVGHIIMGDYGPGLIALFITVAGGYITKVFLLDRADREDTLVGEHDAHEMYDQDGDGRAD